MKTRENKFAEGYVCLTCYRTVEKCMFIFGEFTSNTDTPTKLVHVQSPSMAPRYLLTLSHLLLSYVMREPKCPELSSVGDVKSVHQYMTVFSPL